MSISRRVALRTLAAAGATALLPKRARARTVEIPAEKRKAILYDSVQCIGCRQCVAGCAEQNGWDPEPAFTSNPSLSSSALTVMRRYSDKDDTGFLKVQCMHCEEPACVSACMLGAMNIDADGAVTWNGDLCVGCRYCQIACPFNVPRFEWNSPVPKMRKCQMCPELRAQGKAPACVAQCRRGALSYGTRTEMLREAHRRIKADPASYNHKVYGEKDNGGTGYLYLTRAGVSFAELGLPNLTEESVVEMPEKIQRTIYKGFAAPLALFGTLGVVVRRNAARLHEEEAAHHATEKSVAVGGTLLNTPTLLFVVLAMIGVFTVLWRFAAGLGATTNLNDGYPMGLWIAFDVVVGTALACGGYAVAFLVYVINRGKYHPLIRPALVTSAFGYTLGGLSVLVDIGRPWNFYRIPLFFWEWNFSSILLEVALCIMLYTMVLWIEVSPALLEGWQESRHERLRKIAVTLAPKMEKALPYFIALGLLLPTMHQSSLGSLMLMAGSKLHPLWHTPLLPLLFLVSCVGMGYAAVTLECCISSWAFKRPKETPMLRALAVPIATVLLLYSTLRIADIIYRGKIGYITAMDFDSVLFLCEMALFIVPAVLLIARRRLGDSPFFMSMAALVIAAGSLYRFSTYLIAFHPGPQWHYFPAWSEFAVTIGFLSAEIAGYIILVRRFPILRGHAEPRRGVSGSQERIHAIA